MHVDLIDAWRDPSAREFFVNTWPMYLHEIHGLGCDFYTLDGHGRWQPDLIADWTAERTLPANLRPGPPPDPAEQPLQRTHVIARDGVPVGFACVGQRPFRHMPDDVDLTLAELFVAHAQRGGGLPKRAVALLFQRYRGRWQLVALRDNARAIAFWSKVLPALGVHELERRIEDGDVSWRFRT